MNKHMRIFISILLILCFCVGCMGSIVQVDIKTLDDTSDLEQELHTWIDGINEDGIYIGKIPNTRRHEDYYIFIKNQRIRGYSVSPDSNKGLRIDVEFTHSSDLRSAFFKISTINKKPKYIIFLNSRINPSDITIIKE